MNIIISNEAESDIKEIFDYISLDSLKYAKETTRNIRSYIRKLKQAPYIGRYIPEFKNKHYRELIYKNYRIVYTISENKKEIYIHFVVHGTRNFKTFFNLYIKKFFNF